MPDIIICGETWNLWCFKLFTMEDYNIYYNKSYVNKADGVVIYVRRCIDHSAIQ